LAVAILIVRIALAAVFLAAALSKLASFRRTWARVRLFGVPEALARPTAVALPAIEVVVGVLLVPDATARAGGLLGTAALVVFAVAVIRLMVRHEAPECTCFGLLHSSRVGPGMLVRNLVLASLGATVAAAGPGTALGVAFAAWATLVAVAALVVVALASWRERTRARRRLGAVGKSLVD
jgi:Methylamine utilisation protein MauE